MVYATPAKATGVLGQTATANVIVDGSAVPSGTTLISPSLLQTGSNSARVVLAQGQILELDTNSRAYLEAKPSGELEVVVDGGSVAAASEGEWVRAFKSQRLVFVRPEVQVAQLGGASQAVKVLPIIALASGGCTIDANGGCSADGSGCSTECECTKTDPATGVCEECSCKEPAMVSEETAPATKKGLGRGAWIGIGVGAAAGAAILIDSASDDDEPPASPVN
ncbi:MAG: hypothetical protein AAF657_15075 [Acidobacteriota bacterium]